MSITFITVHRDPEDRDQGLDTSAWLQSSKYQGSRSLSGPQECGSLFLLSGWTLGSGLSSIPQSPQNLLHGHDSSGFRTRLMVSLESVLRTYLCYLRVRV